MPVIKGTRGHKAQQEADVIDSSHPAGFQKIRCPMCKAGMAVKRQGSDGKPEYHCSRCNRVFRDSAI